MAVTYIGRSKVTYRSIRASSDKPDNYSDVFICSSCIALVSSKAGLDQAGFRKVKEDLQQGFFQTPHQQRRKHQLYKRSL